MYIDRCLQWQVIKAIEHTLGRLCAHYITNDPSVIFNVQLWVPNFPSKNVKFAQIVVDRVNIFSKPGGRDSVASLKAATSE